ncbi:serine hydrolase domain-containing protein [Glaciibacter superstes]|uniref:serine hydrolase domain-containing protein n=1 Tax=Glaciibacter superstes TaxID=501023 RepID=UPI0003B2EF6A|nr:serine hydrolase domain-containing protein [Glaciibacter superstes]
MGAPRVRKLLVATAAALLAAVLTGATAQSAQALVAPPIPTPVTTAELNQADVDAWLDGLLPAALDRSGIAGAAVSVVHDGAVLTERGFGRSDTGNGETPAKAVDPESTLFRVGSVSKLFTATSVLQLVESGDLDLDTDVNDYLDFTLPATFDEPITLRHLLTHTAGFEERLDGNVRSDGNLSLHDFVSINPPERVFEPGTVPAYSNYSNALAGYIVERVSGMPFEEYVDRQIFDRIGMDSSSFEQPLPAPLASRLSNAYANASGPAAPFEFVGPVPAGALSASTADISQFMLAQLGELPDEQSLFSDATRELMQQPALDADSLGAFASGPRMTLGFFDDSRNGHRIIGHGGDTQFFHSHLQLFPDERTGIYVTLNSSGASPIDTLELREAVVQGFADRYFPATSGATETTVTDTGAEHAALAAGTYETSRSFQSTFISAIGLPSQVQVTTEAEGRLLITPGPESLHPALFEEIEPWVWQEVDGQRIITLRESDGAVDAIGFSSAFAFLRVDTVHNSAIAFPVLGVSAAVLLGSLLLWPIGAFVRRRLNLPARVGRKGSVVRILTRVGSGSAVLALVGWLVSIMLLLGDQSLPELALRALQGLQLIGVLAIVPAVLNVINGIRHHTGWKILVGRILVVLALGGVAWFALVFKLIAPSVSY